ncbi:MULTISPECIES: 30S ribosomal protein S10 [unclassified Mycoplasma]|uniref:30S ribosomal protein S10 n=1 Tax=unclassified Mycoplasma TaxID=2683645 RepID=UPI000FDD7D59
MSQVKIKIRAYEAALVDQAARKITTVAEQENAKVSGPVPMPTRKEIFTVIRPTHIYKKSREQFEIRTHKRLIVLSSVSEKLLTTLKRLEVPSGVEIQVDFK